jgi:hypothetical protein
MPDTAQLDMGGGGGGGGSSIPNWVMIVGAAAGVLGLVILLKGQGGGGTTAAGTSINAALGSIQEENMNLLGTTQAGFMQTQQGLTSGFMNTQQSFGSLGNQMTSGFTNTNGLIGHLEEDITAQLTAFSGQSQSNYANLTNLISSGQASQAQYNQAETSLLTSIQNDVTAGLVGQQQANQAMNSISAQIGGTQADVGAIGRFLGWQFYQIPNRYQAYIPNQQPGGLIPAGSSVIGSV